MTTATFFVQECPTCGRRLQIRVQYLGKPVQCQHCHAEFEAFDDSTIRPLTDSEADLMARVDELLATAEDQDPAV